MTAWRNRSSKSIASGTKYEKTMLYELLYADRKLVDYFDKNLAIIPAEFLKGPEPHPRDFDYKKWMVLKRIGAVGLLWNRPSDAWLGIGGLKAAERCEFIAPLDNLMWDRKRKGRCSCVSPLLCRPPVLPPAARP